MGKLSNALLSIVSEVSVVVGPKTTTRAIIAAGKLAGQASAKADQILEARRTRKALFNKLNS